MRTNQQAFDVVRRYGEVLSGRLNDTNRAVILEIKAACWRYPEYRRGFTSGDVYAAVLDRGVRDVPTRAFTTSISTDPSSRRTCLRRR